MKKSLFNDARLTLKPLGMALFYLYIFITLAGGVGVIYGVVNLILDSIHNDIGLSSLIESTVFIVVSFFVAKIFYKEIFSLLSKEEVVERKKSENEFEEPGESAGENVIPFVSKSTRQHAKNLSDF